MVVFGLGIEPATTQVEGSGVGSLLMLLPASYTGCSLQAIQGAALGVKLVVKLFCVLLAILLGVVDEEAAAEGTGRLGLGELLSSLYWAVKVNA